MSGEPKRYGWFSQKTFDERVADHTMSYDSDTLDGYCRIGSIYSTPDGEEVLVTNVTFSPHAEEISGEDAVLVGEVVSFIRTKEREKE